MVRALFAGGGTGGHLFPAIAIAREMTAINENCRIEFVGTRYGIEYRMKDDLDYPLSLIAIRGLSRTFSLSLILFPFRLMIAVIQSLKICSRFKPDVIVGTGGYVAGPVIIAAAIKGIPRVLQEQNSYPGLVTRKLANRADIVFTAYEKAEEYLPDGVICKRIGNPVRHSITTGDRTAALEKFGLKQDRTTILILGGSQGAHRINEAVLKSLKYLDDKIQLLWQCGKRDYKDVAVQLDKTDFDISLFPFSNDMEAVYAAADLAVARAGALTIAELTACGIPSVLIPYPYAAADHQAYNAAEVAAAGAARVIRDDELDNIELLKAATEIIRSDRLEKMRDAAKALGRPEAAADIAREILHLAGNERNKIDSSDQDGPG
jgi:UDP-N-acetylglucosamine--N-acetylmuramyl-(pentapeptide) pyrophosphoryl-undecaprenol N-acetylglucosamine transferase